MRTWLKVTIGIIFSLTIIFIVGGYIFYNSLTESLPVYEGELKTPSLKSEVKIYFDSLAIPYIIGGNDEDVSCCSRLPTRKRENVLDGYDPSRR